jgi:hypothetical protein
MKRRLLVSFSGGRTSAYMLWWLLNKWEDRHNWEIIVVFSNTGKEAEGTLFFVDECSQEWGVPIVWVEAKHKDENGIPFSEKGWSVKHKIVTYETASRNGEPFEEMISILGIPSTNAPFCSYQLKKLAIESFIKSMGWEDYYKAIGFRYDEPNRIPENWLTQKLLLPLVFENPTTKPQVVAWWQKQSFDLAIHPDDGNCDGCWKKDDARLARIYNRKPTVFDWWELMGDKYGMMNPRNVPLEPPFNFYRGNKSVMDIRKLAELSQAEIKQLSMFQESFNQCNESCESA